MTTYVALRLDIDTEGGSFKTLEEAKSFVQDQCRYIASDCKWKYGIDINGDPTQKMHFCYLEGGVGRQCRRRDGDHFAHFGIEDAADGFEFDGVSDDERLGSWVVIEHDDEEDG